MQKALSLPSVMQALVQLSVKQHYRVPCAPLRGDRNGNFNHFVCGSLSAEQDGDCGDAAVRHGGLRELSDLYTAFTASVVRIWFIKEQLIFPEIEYDKVDKVRGMDVIFVTTAKTDEEARELLAQFNMPFTK